MAVGRRVRRSLGLGALAATVWAMPAEADAPGFGVTPADGLQDGDTVVAGGSGFPAGSSAGLLQCPLGADPPMHDLDRCAVLPASVSIGADGRFQTEVVVRREQPDRAGGTLRCGNAREDCRVWIIALTDVGGGHTSSTAASASISFAPQPK